MFKEENNGIIKEKCALYLPFFPGDLALKYETGQSEVDINVVTRKG